MTRLRSVVILLAVLFSACASARVDDIGSNDVVVLVSFDGFRHDYLDRGLTPNFARLAARGMRADALIPIFPTKTFPNHYSIVTGMYAEHHNLVGNEFYDPHMGLFNNRGPDWGRWLGGEPIWVTAERQGVRSASLFWVGGDTPINGQLPTYWKKYDERWSAEARVDTVVAWLELPPPSRPRLALLYFEMMDDAGHDFGPDSPQVDSALVHADAALGRLLAGIAKTPAAQRTTIIVVSDHGMTATSPARKILLDSIVDLGDARVVVSGAYSTLYFTPWSMQRDSIVATLKRDITHARVFTRDSMPERFHWRDNARIPDVLVLPDEGWSVGTTKMLASLEAGGAHGYDPALASMRGIFLAAGPGIRPGTRLPAFENIHIHPFMAEILGIRPAPNIDGRGIRGTL